MAGHLQGNGVSVHPLHTPETVASVITAVHGNYMVKNEKPIIGIADLLSDYQASLSQTGPFSSPEHVFWLKKQITYLEPLWAYLNSFQTKEKSEAELRKRVSIADNETLQSIGEHDLETISVGTGHIPTLKERLPGWEIHIFGS